MWFRIKCNPSITMASKHLHETIVRVRKLDSRTQDITKPVIQRNAYYGHCENILFNMIHDHEDCVRELGWRRILKARSSTQDTVRAFKPPTLNFNAETYYEMIDWNSLELTEPPLTKSVKTKDIIELIETGDMPIFKSQDIPCHTQSVERHIKLVTEASEKVCGGQKRDGLIKATLFSRQQMPIFNTKKEFKM